MGRLAVDHGVDIVNNTLPGPFRDFTDQKFLNAVTVDVVIGKADPFERIAVRAHAKGIVHRAHILFFQASRIPLFDDCLKMLCQDISVQVFPFCAASIDENAAVGALHELYNFLIGIVEDAIGFYCFFTGKVILDVGGMIQVNIIERTVTGRQLSDLSATRQERILRRIVRHVDSESETAAVCLPGSLVVDGDLLLPYLNLIGSRILGGNCKREEGIGEYFSVGSFLCKHSGKKREKHQDRQNK